MTDLMLTKNTDKLCQEVAAHVAADSIIQGVYWDSENKRGCFIGCLAKSNDPAINEATYGLPVMVQRIAENIFEALSPDQAKAFFTALPDAVACDGKDLTKVAWQFLAAGLRSLPEQPAEVQAVIDPVIAGMDLLASGQEWSASAADAAAWTATRVANAAAAAAAAWTATRVANAAAAAAAARAAADAVWAAADAADAAAWTATRVANAADAADAAADAAWAAADAVRLRQRNLLLRLISEAPVVENY